MKVIRMLEEVGAKERPDARTERFGLFQMFLGSLFKRF
jgi:hypothetical protein